MNPTQAVILTQLLSFIIFWVAGDEATRKTKNGLQRLRGKPATGTKSSEDSGPKMTVQVAAGWAVMFVILIILTDVPATSELGSAFAWLILVSIALAFGEDAFANISSVLTQKV